MGRMESPREQVTVSVRVDAELKNNYKDAVDSMSEDLREHMTEVAASSDVASGPLPDDEVLADAYQALRRHAAPDTRRVNVEIARSAIAETTRISKGAVRERVLHPLEREGYITPKWGTVVVHLSEQVTDD